MTRAEAQLILGVYRPGTADADDPFFAEALALARTDEELGHWFAEEQAFDEFVTAKLRAVEPPAAEAPASLLEMVRSTPAPGRVVAWNFRRALALAASVALLSALATWFLVPKEANASLADFRSEMVSFVKIPPPLELETSDLAEVRSYLRASSQIGAVTVPGGTGELPPVGCRTLSFRGYAVALICFQREDGELVHLVMVPQAALPKLAAGAEPAYTEVGEWATASWAADDLVYLLATKGDREQLQAYL